MKLNREKFADLMTQKGLKPENLPFKPHEAEWILSGKTCTYRVIEQCALFVGVDPAEITIVEPNMSGENVIEFLRYDEMAMLTLCKQKYIRKIRKLAKERSEQCQIMAENLDGTIIARVPVSWIKINPGKILTDEQREQARVNAINNFHADSNR